jgi:hypothetical protein
MIRIERDPAFWRDVAAHPAVVPALLGLTPEAVGELAERIEVLPIAAEHGGFLVVRRDPLGFVGEIHSLFTPEGWGREATQAGWEALNGLWLSGFQTLVTFEAADNPRSRPWRSFGFQQSGPWRETASGVLRQWVLTREAFFASPSAKRRRARCQ